jgi:hypothetical protein
MSNKLLLPNKYKLIGWCILIPATILGLILIYTDFEAFQYTAKVFSVFEHNIMSKRQTFSFIETNISNTVVGV